jgi:dTMP kinase
MKEGNGKIIALEGLDGCGKGAQIQKLKEMVGYDDEHRRDVRYRSRRVVFSREPGGTDFAEQMRTIIKDGMGNLSGRTQLFNFFAARSDHWERVVVPAVQRGDLVILDRSDMSTFAFQIYGQKAEGEDLRKFFWTVRDFVYGEYQPDLYIFIRVSPEECQRRILSALKEKGREVSNFDARDLDFHHAVHIGYTVFAADDRTATVNGEQAIDLVHRDIRQLINALLQ